jgi:hypothetical protein
VEPVVTVISVPVNLISQLFIVDVKWVFSEEHLMHDDSKRKHIIFISIVISEAVVLGGAVGHGEAWLVGCIFVDILLSSG